MCYILIVIFHYPINVLSIVSDILLKSTISVVLLSKCVLIHLLLGQFHRFVTIDQNWIIEVYNVQLIKLNRYFIIFFCFISSDIEFCVSRFEEGTRSE